MTRQFIGSGKSLITDQTLLGQELFDVLVEQQLRHVAGGDSLHHHTVSIKFRWWQLGAVLQGSVVFAHVLLESMPRGVHLTAGGTAKSVPWVKLSMRHCFTGVDQMHGILTQYQALMFLF